MSEKQSNGIRGGKRLGAGRKKGVPNKRTAELQKKVEESGLTPLEFLLSVMRNDVGEPKDRMAAAIAAAPYVHARLSSVDLKADVQTRTLDQAIAELDAAEPRSSAH